MLESNYKMWTRFILVLSAILISQEVLLIRPQIFPEQQIKTKKIGKSKGNNDFLFNGRVSYTGTLMALRLQNYFNLHPQN